ncbi:Rieske (2Fe-2S) protein [Caulobacter sp.]|uniref:Rieske (2Fe-2S) protein n=1 Tax=Caulobacter sp. TaxID=78 RepID=UPI001B1F54B1|nr:Rieske (2Fe-2S) protein [Caulobacter sp.]MBO9546739.1 Rieske (2Fe-2S) protein [Caulobacter sp.]
MSEEASAVARIWSTRAGINLGPLDLIPDGKARNYVLQIGEARFHGFVVRKGEAVFGYVDRCPHAGLPLAQELDRYLTPDGDLIMCSWHGAVFTVEEGTCVGGPCVGARLSPWPVEALDGRVVTAAPPP